MLLPYELLQKSSKLYIYVGEQRERVRYGPPGT